MTTTTEKTTTSTGVTVSLDPGKIRIGKRIRLDIGNVGDLMRSIEQVGQLHPILVMQNGGRPEIVAGYRRVLACKQLGIEVRAEVVEPIEALKRLEMEIHENTRRKDFDRAELGEGMLRHKRLYEQLHPQTKPGGAGRGRPKAAAASEDQPAPKRYTLVAAETMGMSERTAQQLVAVGKELEGNEAAQKRLKAATTVAERNQIVQELEREAKRKAKMEALVAKKRERELQDDPKPAVVLHLGDSAELMVGEEIYELVLTDPPYDRKRSLIGHATRATVNPEEHAWDKLDVGWLLKASPLLVPGGQVLIFCPLEAIGAYELACQAAGLEYRMSLIWCKTNPGTAHRATYLHGVEAIVWAVKPGGKVYFEDWASQAGGAALNWFEGPICGGNERLAHPTQKPLWLVTRLLQRHTTEGHRVLDPFAGVGTTGAAARELGLACTLIEKDPRYVKMARARLEAMT